MEILRQYALFLIPIAILQLALFVSALVHLLRHKRTRNLSVTLWAIIIFINIIGPVLYFLIGREED